MTSGSEGGSEGSFALLPDRGVVSVAGRDADKLLQGLITNDMGLLDSRAALFAGLLSPQGKILFDFLIVKAGDGYLLDVTREKAGDLAKRLTLYRLRADVRIADVSGAHRVMAAWGDALGSAPAGAIVFVDPRLSELGERWIVEMRERSPPHEGEGDDAAECAAACKSYHAHRIALGVPEGGRDYVLGDTFPHEALYDEINGVSFMKGCYVGQEIVSRMEHRGTARKRVVQVAAAAPLPLSGTEVMAGDVAIGALGSVDGTRGLALVRLDRAAEFKAKGVPLTAGTIAITISKPSWARFALEPGAS